MLGAPDELQIGLNADHGNMCRFSSPEDNIYIQVQHNIVYLVQEVIKSARSGGNAGPSETPHGVQFAPAAEPSKESIELG